MSIFTISDSEKFTSTDLQDFLENVQKTRFNKKTKIQVTRFGTFDLSMIKKFLKAIKSYDGAVDVILIERKGAYFIKFIGHNFEYKFYSKELLTIL